jgi:hypothetical protein
MGISSVKAVVVASVDFEELICAITRYAVATLGCNIASNNRLQLEKLGLDCRDLSASAEYSSTSRMLGCWREQRAFSIRVAGNAAAWKVDRHKRVGGHRVERQEPAVLCRGSHAPLSTRGICLAES